MGSLVRALGFWSVVAQGLVCAATVTTLAADSSRGGDSNPIRQSARTLGEEDGAGRQERPSDAVDDATPVIDVLEGIRSRQLNVAAEGTGDGRMTLSVTNRTQKKLRVVLPPGLVAAGLSGQFGGMGGGGRGGRSGRGGRGGPGMGGGMGPGGGGMGMGGMGQGGGMMSSGTMPASMGMMMVGNLIMSLVGERDSWDQTTLMSGMMGGGRGMMMGMGGRGMGGMGMGMSGRGGGFRSVPSGRTPETTLKAKETRHLSTLAISLDRPGDDGRAIVPAKGERLRLGEVGQLKLGSRTEQVLKRLGATGVPESMAQLVLWNVAAGVDWSRLSRLSENWANSAELTLAKQYVSGLNQAGVAPGTPDVGHFFWEDVSGDSDAPELAAAMAALLQKHQVLGLHPERGVPNTPSGPALACRFAIAAGKATVALAKSDVKGRNWSSLGSLTIPVRSHDDDPSAVESQAVEVIDAMSAGLLAKVARAELVKGPKAKGKETYTIRVDNGSPLILSGLAIAGADPETESSKPIPFTALGGVSLAPLTSLKLPVTPELVEQLGLKQRIRVVAVDFNGL